MFTLSPLTLQPSGITLNPKPQLPESVPPPSTLRWILRTIQQLAARLSLFHLRLFYTLDMTIYCTQEGVPSDSVPSDGVPLPPPLCFGAPFATQVPCADGQLLTMVHLRLYRERLCFHME
jgi:hypothetical protein